MLMICTGIRNIKFKVLFKWNKAMVMQIGTRLSLQKQIIEVRKCKEEKKNELYWYIQNYEKE